MEVTGSGVLTGIVKDAIEGQLTYLVFLKMDEERSNPPLNKESKVPEELS